MSKLVIVESPTKVKTISKFLSKDYKVASSKGHIRDLPKSKLGVDVEHNFEPHYVIPDKAKKTIEELKKLAKKADNILFATDEDREGEAISWHLAHILKIDPKKAQRIVFHEITKDAILEALENPRGLDQRLVDAQQARRVLDRLVGYKLSPLLWKKIARGLSAGRVQSVAVRLIVEREREIEAFKPQEYWTIESLAKIKDDPEDFKIKLHKRDGKVLEKLAIKTEADAKKIVDEVTGKKFTITDITKKEGVRKPLAPFTTSTMQQESHRRLSMSARDTMRVAQQLYEGVNLGPEGNTGLITYMRTDSVNLADKFLNDAAAHIKSSYGDDYYEKRAYKSKSKNAQEAHEAVRPTEAARTPNSIKQYLDPKQFKLYQLIWQRAVASQMANAKSDNTTVEITPENTPYTFTVKGSILTFKGFLEVYPTNTKDEILPPLEKGQEIEILKLESLQHFTEPPARYSEATLIKALEENGIGRPSTYAPTISTIITRGYVTKNQDKKLEPSDVAKLVNDVLVEHFPEIVDYQFTANLEDDLDEIALGHKQWVPTITAFYNKFNENLMQKEEELDKKKLTEEKSEEKCEKCGSDMVIKMGRFGKFLACTNYPECKNTKNLGSNGEPEEQKVSDEKCEKCDNPMAVKTGRFGKFLACTNYPECKNTKPIVKSTGVKCPKCGKGEIVEKKSRRGKTFFACDQYPNCENSYWSKPTGEKCPDSGDLLVFGPKGTAKCSDKECKYTAEIKEAAK
ncbi:MAG: type I DNA topoisomerase [Candidatus Buchananbacteria bacterium CG10_big_fil_rev_8_21_14_0_10_42_9]|uniref:DNA topoisomerase 1 n=1 Tax=Candidatus Buchananbacteria bacterium CG10_big_fil_rev_8_21_14_0_10_42_9 TaxID=1974526 RepID=A0A2H0W189_9BACT|nr:MAG: type I DNA topoisomerase [Candidatus Buchananbacteria bacterium CG10_big_fil_rev_8_21_14_0_10_42_9]